MSADGETGADIAARLAAVRRRVERAARAAGREAGAVTLVAVGKTHGGERMRAAIAAGQRAFGENRVQEAEAKWPLLKAEFADVRLHLIGPLQSNKARRAVALFDAVETIDRLKIAEAVARAMAESGRRPDLLIQVNTGAEPRKAGVAAAQADAFIGACRGRLKLPVKGLMCIPPLDADPVPHFALLAEIARRNGLAELSMGMSADFETAIRMGATIVRVGTAIFGAREEEE